MTNKIYIIYYMPNIAYVGKIDNGRYYFGRLFSPSKRKRAPKIEWNSIVLKEDFIAHIKWKATFKMVQLLKRRYPIDSILQIDNTMGRQMVIEPSPSH